MIYLAAPYSHTDPQVVRFRMETFAKVDLKLMNDGIFTVSPLLKALLTEYQPEMNVSWEFWQEYCIELLSKCNMLVVICLPGWRESTGVSAEIEHAKRLEIDIQYLDIDNQTMSRIPTEY